MARLKRRARVYGLLSIGVVSLAALAGWGLIRHSGSRDAEASNAIAQSSGPLVVGHATSSFSFESLQDLRDWSDMVAVVEVHKETAEPDDIKDSRPGAHLVRRRLQLSIDANLWARAPFEALDEVEVYTQGWTKKAEGGMAPFTTDGAIRMNVGERYVVGLMRDEDGLWWTYPGAVLSFDGARLVTAPGSPPSVQDLSGLTVSEFGSKYAQTLPNPDIEKYSDYAADDRAKMVGLEARTEAGTASPTENRPEPTVP